MKAPKIVLGFYKLSDPAFETKALAIVAAMTGNPNLPSPTPPLADLSTAVQNYSGALSAAPTRDKLKVSIKNDMRSNLETVLQNLSFNVNSETSNPQPMSLPENFKVELGANSGEVVISVNSVPGARSYIYQYTPFPVTTDSKWENAYSSSSSNTISNLDVLKQYCFRIVITGPRDQSAQTGVITKTVV